MDGWMDGWMVLSDTVRLLYCTVYITSIISHPQAGENNCLTAAKYDYPCEEKPGWLLSKVRYAILLRTG